MEAEGLECRQRTVSVVAGVEGDPVPTAELVRQKLQGTAAGTTDDLAQHIQVLGQDRH